MFRNLWPMFVIATVWWVEPNHLSVFRSVLTGRLGVEVEFIVLFAVFESFLVWSGDRVKGTLVTRDVGKAVIYGSWYFVKD